MVYKANSTLRWQATGHRAYSASGKFCAFPCARRPERVGGFTTIRHEAAIVLFGMCLLICAPLTVAQQTGRTKVAEGEYRVSIEGDLGLGPMETEIFHFRESWTLWKTSVGYELEGYRTYASPRNELHDNRFVAELSADLRPLSIKEFAQLAFRSDSGPLSCELLPQQLRCDSGGKDPARVQFALDRPYALIWPLSAFSLAGLTRAATELDKPTPIQIVQLEQISYALPVLAIRSDGLIRYRGQSQEVFSTSGRSFQPKVYELTTSPTGKMTIWTSPEGLLLAAAKSSWPKGRIELVNFKKFAEF